MWHDHPWLRYAEFLGYAAAGIMLTGLVILALVSAALDVLG